MESANALKVAIYSDIEAAENALREAQRSYLKRFGWTQTCNTPGSFWLWMRDFAAEDKQRHAWWKKASADLAELRKRGRTTRRPPSEPRPYGVITADTEMAVQMTVRTLDDQSELAEREE
jgi:glutamate mutase epsilon subunit